MASFYGRMRKAASKLLGKFGEKITIQRIVQGEYDPETGEYGAEETLEWEPYALKTSISLNDIDGTRIEAGDMVLLVSMENQTSKPEIGDFVIFPNGETWKIIQPMPVEPASETVLFKAVIRKG